MALNERLKGRADQAYGPTYTADRRLYLDRDGKVVEADDPGRVALLAAQGASIPRARAAELGLVDAEGNAVPRQAAAAAEAPKKSKPGPDDPESAYASTGGAPDNARADAADKAGGKPKGGK